MCVEFLQMSLNRHQLIKPNQDRFTGVMMIGLRWSFRTIKLENAKSDLMALVKIAVIKTKTKMQFSSLTAKISDWRGFTGLLNV